MAQWSPPPALDIPEWKGYIPDSQPYPIITSVSGRWSYSWLSFKSVATRHYKDNTIQRVLCATYSDAKPDQWIHKFLLTSIKPMDFTSLIEEVREHEGCKNTFWSLISVTSTNVQIFRPVLFLVRAAEGKTGLLLWAFIIGFGLCG